MTNEMTAEITIAEYQQNVNELWDALMALEMQLVEQLEVSFRCLLNARSPNLLKGLGYTEAVPRRSQGARSSVRGLTPTALRPPPQKKTNFW